MMIRDLFLKKTTPHIPLWFMRQAGRYLPEYMAIRKNFDDFIQFCYTPNMAAEVTLQPMRRFDLDAAIIFSDILVIPDALGQKVSFQKDHGPVLGTYDLSAAMKTKPTHITNHLSKVYEAIALTRSTLPSDKTLFGFAGTPWTLACYMVEEGKSQGFKQITRYSANAEFTFLLQLLTNTVVLHLINQIEAGADIVQIFDSWAIKAPVGMEKEFLIDPFIQIAKAIHAVYPATPIVYYSRCEKDLYLKMLKAIEIECPDSPLGMGIWQGVDMTDIRGHTTIPLQGNIDPKILLVGGKAMEDEARRMCESMAGHPFIFNLGHGVIKETPPEHVAQLVAAVRSYPH